MGLLNRKDIKEGMRYEHEDHGLVQVTAITKNHVMMILQNQIFINGVGTVPKGKKEDPAVFCTKAEPHKSL